MRLQAQFARNVLAIIHGRHELTNAVNQNVAVKAGLILIVAATTQYLPNSARQA